MKRRFTLITAAVMLLTMMASTGIVWGQTKATTILTLDCATPAPTGSTSTALSGTSDVATFLNSAAGLSNAENKITCSEKTGDVYKGKGSGGGDIPQQCLKVGKASGGGGFTFTIPNNYDNIDIVEITCYGWKTSSSISINGGTAHFTTAQVEVTKTFELANSTRTITVSVTSSAVCITQIVLKKNDSGSGSDPSISANDVNIAYNATNGSIAYTLTNATGNVSASVTTGDWLTLGEITSSAVPFTCSANTGAQRTATVTLSFEGADDKVVTVTQAAAPVTYTTIPEIFAAATTTETNVNVTFGNWVVSGVNSSNAYVTDNIGNGFIIYKGEHGFAVNAKLSGTVTGTPLKLYSGSAEFTNLTSSTTGLNVTDDGEITVITNKTIAELGGVNTGAVITLNGLTYNGTNLSDGTNTIKPYNSLYSSMSFTSGKTYNVTGVYLQYGNTKEIMPRSAADIVLAPAVATPSFSPTEGTYTSVQNITISCATEGATIYYTDDGTTPTTSSTQYTSAIEVAETKTLQAIAVKAGMNNSAIATAAYTINLPIPTVSVVPSTVNATNAGGNGTLIVSYNNITTVVAEVYFCTSTGEATTYNWIDAEINNSNNVDYLIDANTGAARTAYLKVTHWTTI